MLDLVLKVLSVVLRLVLLVAGLVFFASVLAAGLLLLLVWMVRALWARLTGKPVTPWVFRLNKHAKWDPFRRGGSGAHDAPQGDVVDAVVRDVPDAPAGRIETRREP